MSRAAFLVAVAVACSGCLQLAGLDGEYTDDLGLGTAAPVGDAELDGGQHEAGADAAPDAPAEALDASAEVLVDAPPSDVADGAVGDVVDAASEDSGAVHACELGGEAVAQHGGHATCSVCGITGFWWTCDVETSGKQLPSCYFSGCQSDEFLDGGTEYASMCLPCQ